MRYYRSYMDRQALTAGAHEKLMGLDKPRGSPQRPWIKYGALAACAALIVGVGAWRLAPTLSDSPAPAASDPLPVQTEAAEPFQQDAAPGAQASQGFVVSAPADADKLAFLMVPAIIYQDLTDDPEIEADRALLPGSFTVVLEKEDIQTIFWGPEDKPDATYPKLEQGDLPWTLFWDGYTVSGTALYDSEGQLTELTLYGEKDGAGFTLELRLGAMPFTCCIDMEQSDQLSECNGVEVAGWSKVYDRDGDGRTDYICGSEFMTKDDVGVRFTNVNSAMRSEYGGSEDMTLGGAQSFNALFVRQALADDGGLYLDHLMTADPVPAWRDVTFDTLEQARQETDFAPYLPETAPEGGGEFYGRLSYQEGVENTLFVRWTRGYDDVEVEVILPEGDDTGCYRPVDIDVPESYDTRLYDTPWSDSVPEQYRTDFYDVTFRAEDLSLDAVMAREVPHDTGGVTFRFNVLHPNGVVVSYLCDGLTAQQVWELVERTLA